MEQKINLKSIGIILAWVAIIVGIAYFIPFNKIIPSRVTDDEKAGVVNAKLVADHYEYDFGTIQITGGKVRHSYRLKNEGPDSLRISKVFTSCMCTTAQVKMTDGKVFGPFGMSGHGSDTSAEIAVPAGQEVELTIEFDPMAHGPDAIGPIQRVVYVKTDVAKEPLGVSFTANVVK